MNYNAKQVVILTAKIHGLVWDLIAAEEEFYSNDGGGAEPHTFEIFKRDDGGYGVKCETWHRDCPEDKLVYYGDVVRCLKCGTIHFVFDNPDEECWVCEKQMTIEYARRRR